MWSCTLDSSQELVICPRQRDTKGAEGLFGWWYVAAFLLREGQKRVTGTCWAWLSGTGPGAAEGAGAAQLGAGRAEQAEGPGQRRRGRTPQNRLECVVRAFTVKVGTDTRNGTERRRMALKCAREGRTAERCRKNAEREGFCRRKQRIAEQAERRRKLKFSQNGQKAQNGLSGKAGPLRAGQGRQGRTHHPGTPGSAERWRGGAGGAVPPGMARNAAQGLHNARFT